MASILCILRRAGHTSGCRADDDDDDDDDDDLYILYFNSLHVRLMYSSSYPVIPLGT